MIYFELQDIDLTGFGLYINSIDVKTDIGGMEFTLTFTSTITPTNPNIENIEDFLKALQIMNAVKSSTTPGVKDQYERLLTILALSS